MATIAVIGHRGARGLCPENTRAGFLRAVELGCDAVELDVHLTADRVLAVIHDATLDRTTNGKGPVAARTMAELRRLDAGEGEKVPSLDELLDLLAPTGIRIQIELKGPGTEEAAPLLVRKRGIAERVTFTSFHHRRVLVAGRLCPEALRGILVSCNPVDPIALLEPAGARNLHVRHDLIDQQLVRLLRQGGKCIVAWGDIVSEQTVDRLVELGVDGMGSDRPDIVLERLRALGRRAG